MAGLHPRLATRLAVAALIGAAAASPGRVEAHHGSAEYHVDREITVTGTVQAFRWINPHIRIVVSVVGKDGRVEEWDCEGPPLTWAAGRGWSAATLQEGERVTLAMYPARESARSGLVKRIEKSGGEILPVTRPWLGER